MKHEIIKQFNEKLNAWRIYCSEGHRITTWREGDDIKKYSAFAFAYCPKDVDFSIYRCVTAKEHAEYIKACRKAQKEEAEQRNKDFGKEELSTIEVK